MGTPASTIAASWSFKARKSSSVAAAMKTIRREEITGAEFDERKKTTASKWAASD
jgi:hypothetical protein